jgi:hypothetical protein
MDCDDFERWSAARKRVAATLEAADERGGPSLSLVPIVDQDEPWPTDLLPAQVREEDAAPTHCWNPDQQRCPDRDQDRRSCAAATATERLGFPAHHADVGCRAPCEKQARAFAGWMISGW